MATLIDLQFKANTGDLDKAKQSLRDIKEQSGALQGTFTKAATAGNLLADAIKETVHAVAEFVKASIEAADETVRMANNLGVSIEKMSELRIAAKLSGVTLDEVAVSMEKLQKAAAQALAGNDAQRKAFQNLGMSMDEVKAKQGDAAALFTSLLKHTTDYAAGANKAAAETELLGKSGWRMNELADELERAHDIAEKYGLTLDEVTGKSIKEFGDQMTIISLVLENFVIKAAGPVIEWMDEVITKGGPLNEVFEGLGTVAKWVTTIFDALMTTVVELGHAIGALFAATAAAASGEFTQAKNILKDFGSDFAKMEKDFEDRRQKMYSGKSNVPNGFASKNSQSGKPQADAPWGDDDETLKRVNERLNAMRLQTDQINKLNDAAKQSGYAFEQAQIKADALNKTLSMIPKGDKSALFASTYKQVLEQLQKQRDLQQDTSISNSFRSIDQDTDNLRHLRDAAAEGTDAFHAMQMEIEAVNKTLALLPAGPSDPKWEKTLGAMRGKTQLSQGYKDDATVAQNMTATKQQTSDLEALYAAQKKGIESYDATLARLKAEAFARSIVTGMSKEETNALIEQYAAQQKLAALTQYAGDMNSLKDQIHDTEALRAAKAKGNDEYEKEAAHIAAVNWNRQHGNLLTEEEVKQMGDLNYELSKQNDLLANTSNAWSDYMDSIGKHSTLVHDTWMKAFKGMEDGLVDFCMTGKMNFKALAMSIIQDLVRIMIQKSITGMFGADGPLSGIGGWLGGASATTGASAASAIPIGISHGGVFSNGSLMAFGGGAVVNGTTMFPMANGGTGMMSEQNPEAIMPLTRTSNGKLGVATTGSGNGGFTFAGTVQVVVQGNGKDTADEQGQKVGKAAMDTMRAIARKEFADMHRPGNAGNPVGNQRTFA